MKTDEYDYIIVESFIPSKESGKYGICIRPVEGQDDPYKPNLFVECSKDLITDHPVGTKFRIKAKITDREGTPFIYSSYAWKYEVLK